MSLINFGMTANMIVVMGINSRKVISDLVLTEDGRQQTLLHANVLELHFCSLLSAFIDFFDSCEFLHFAVEYESFQWIS